MDVDLDHAGVRRHLDDVHTRIVGRAIALHLQRQPKGFRAFLQCGDQLQIIFELFNRRHEHAEHAIARLNRHSRAHRADDEIGGYGGFGLARFCDRVMLTQLLRVGQGAARLGGVLRVDVGIVLGRNPRQRLHRQAEADGGIAGHQEQAPATGLPQLADPARAILRVPALHGEHIARRFQQAALKRAQHARALLGVFDLGIHRVDVFRQAAFFKHPMGGVFKGGQNKLGADANAFGKIHRECLRVLD